MKRERESQKQPAKLKSKRRIEKKNLDREPLIQELKAYKSGKRTLSELLDTLTQLPFQTTEFARLDLHRALRKGFPEVVLGIGKTPAQIAIAFSVLARHHNVVLATKITPAQASCVQKKVKNVKYYKEPRLLLLDRRKKREWEGKIVVLTAGTSDIPIAEEAALTTEACGCAVERIFDIGVAGIHRLVSVLPRLQEADAIVAVAGMDGALPSVIGGMVAPPVIAVPTSIGYGAHQKGIASLQTMLNSCAPGVVVVNIDNGFGAGYFAALVAKQKKRRSMK